MNRPLLLGHRGARRYAPENTLPALELALAHGCDGFEFDVRRTADGQCIVCHDPRLGGRTIAQTRYADLAAGCAAPTLADVLRSFCGRAFLDIELKVPGLESDTAALLRRYPPVRRFFVSSFLPEVIEHFHREDATVPLGLICDSRRQLAAWSTLPVAGIFLECRLATASAIDILHEANQQVFVWTVNREREMRRCAALGVEGIISDDTQLLVQTLARDRRSGDLVIG
jgi:glycerophosphoryl diester phosphodiesterase